MNFKGTAKRLEDLDLPRIGARIGVGEDELHAFMDTETRGTGFDDQGRPRILFEPHVFYRCLPAAKRAAAVKQGLACKSWGQIKYGKESAQYGRLEQALKIDETAALKACSWGLGQVLGENHIAAGYETVQEMVKAMMEDEEHHLEAIVNFIKHEKIDDDMRRLAQLKRPTTPDDCRPIVRVYNGAGYEKNDYHTKFAANHNKWRKIKDTPYQPELEQPAVKEPEKPVATPEPEKPAVLPPSEKKQEPDLPAPPPPDIEPVDPVKPAAPGGFFVALAKAFSRLVNRSA